MFYFETKTYYKTALYCELYIIKLYYIFKDNTSCYKTMFYYETL